MTLNWKTTPTHERAYLGDVLTFEIVKHAGGFTLSPAGIGWQWVEGCNASAEAYYSCQQANALEGAKVVLGEIVQGVFSQYDTDYHKARVFYDLSVLLAFATGADRERIKRVVNELLLTKIV